MKAPKFKEGQGVMMNPEREFIETPGVENLEYDQLYFIEYHILRGGRWFLWLSPPAPGWAYDEDAFVKCPSRA